jgi:molecular chaperone DnaK
MAVRGGIDLGTTYSSISWYDAYNNRADTIDLETADGAKVLRSVVYYPGPGQTPVVGDTAWNAKRQFPDRAIVGIKRSMGTDYKTPPLDGVQYTPPQVSAEILKALVKDAQAYLGEEVKDVIITVPAYFGDNERAATEEAGKLAGLNVLTTLPEPHAAALAFAVDKVALIQDRHLLVYDLGGGTFDVTLIHARTEPGAGNALDLKIETLCKDGNMSLGGLDWDRALAEIVAEKVMQAHGLDVQQDPANEAVLMDNCEKAKRHLSRTNSVSIVADSAGHAVEVTRSEFEARTSALLLQTEMLLDKVIDDAEKQHGVTKDRIEVLLTGGASKMPMVREMVEAKMGRAPIQHGNPELLVTIGAAYYAHLLTGKPVPKPVPQDDGTVEQKDVVVKQGGLTDISAYAVGVEVLRPDGKGGMGHFNAVVVPSGARYGEVFNKEFSVVEDGVTEIHIVLYKGDSPNLDQCEQLMSVTISGLPPGRPARLPVVVTMSYDDGGILRGKAKDVTTGKDVDIVFDRSKKVAS